MLTTNRVVPTTTVPRAAYDVVTGLRPGVPYFLYSLPAQDGLVCENQLQVSAV